MALVGITLAVINDALKNAEAAGCTSRRILSLGYPDVLASSAQLAKVFGEGIVDKLVVRADSASILRWHRAANLTDRVIEAPALFEALGFELDVLDIAQVRGGEIIHDLNEPLPDSQRARYAAVLDAGTLEHCFNIAQAAKNVASAVALGGFVMHGNPLNMYNHGFYNLNPTWYYDFYEANGFSVARAEIVFDALGDLPRVSEAPPHNRFKGIPDDATLLVVAHRKAIAEVKWPVQHKYRQHPTLSG